MGGSRKTHTYIPCRHCGLLFFLLYTLASARLIVGEVVPLTTNLVTSRGLFTDHCKRGG